MLYSIRMTEDAEEKSIVENHAKLHRVFLAEAFKSSLFHTIENEYGLKVLKNTNEPLQIF